MPGYTARWIHMVVARYNRAGEQAIGDHRTTLPGTPAGRTASSNANWIKPESSPG